MADVPLPDPIDEDYAAAEKTLRAHADPLTEGADGWNSMREYYAKRRVQEGADWFDIRHGLREPQTRLERLLRTAVAEGWDEKTAEARFPSVVERSVDAEILEDLHTTTVRRLDRYERVLLAIIDAATDQRDIDRSRAFAATPRIDRLWRDAIATKGLDRLEAETAWEFLHDMNADDNQPVRCGGWTSGSAHQMADRLISHGFHLWLSSVKIEHRSRTEHGYSHAAAAADLIYGTLLDNESVPKLPDLVPLLELEIRRAKRVLARQSTEPVVPRVRVAEVEPAAVEQVRSALGEQVKDDPLDVWVPASFVKGKEWPRRLRQATSPNRKGLKVRSTTVEGTKLYAFKDIVHNWPGDITDEMSAAASKYGRRIPAS